MAKTSKIAKNRKRAETIDRYAKRRAELIKIAKDPDASYEEKREAYAQIAKMPRDASATRYRNRCAVSGRPRGYFRKFGLSRIALRNMAHRGELPGIRKASW
ncbi:MAG: 30S ribosomal protein S14 [Acidimicrobiia bacterium]